MNNLLNEDSKASYHGRLRETFKFVKQKDIVGKSILDIGCGYGWFEERALSMNPQLITACEVTSSDLITIKSSIDSKKVVYKVANATDLPFKDGTFDTVVSWEVIEHIPKNTELKMFQEVNRVLKNGGVFYLSTPYKGFWSTLLDPAWWLVGHRHYNLNDLFILSKRSGFKILDTLVKGGFWSIIAILNLYISKWVFRRPPIFREYISQKIDSEFDSPFVRGSVNFFVKFKKP